MTAPSVESTAGAIVEPVAMLRALPGMDPLDVQVATMLVRRGAETGERGVAIVLTAMLVSRALRDGHSALTLAQLARQAGDVQAAAQHPALLSLPLRDERWWQTHFDASALVGPGQLVTPLVRHGGMLQFHRYFAAEQRIAAQIRVRLAAPVADAEVGAVPAFSIITGGPGTGKTTRVAATLVAMVTDTPGLRVALAAPTGKAAARLTESIRLRIASDGITAHASPEVQRALRDLEARTLHRLLSYSGDTDTYRRTAANPLPYDLVIIDEASMVDVLLLDAVLQALRPGARLMLVGDHHQLSSVDAGDVLGVLCRAAADAMPEEPLHRAVTRLTTSWRFAGDAGIGALARAILAGDGDAALAAGRAVASSEPGNGAALVRVMSPDALTSPLEPVIPHLERCLAATSPEALLTALDAFRLLTPEREGRWGVRGLNAAVERWLARHGRPVHEPWYHGRPVLVTANDYATKVFNGDIGVVWTHDGRTAVHFRALDGSLRSIAAGRLPAVETAWALTVHKAQGSEFDDVVVVLPPEASRVMSRELLYTAVTRARRQVTIIGTDSALRAAVAQPTQRTSGLATALGGSLLAAG